MRIAVPSETEANEGRVAATPETVKRFAGLGAARLNPFCLFEPDSAEYLFGSRSLARLEGYLEIDRVGEPAHTFRPPGLPLLLVPLSLVRPYDAVAAKVALLVCCLGLLVSCLGLLVQRKCLQLCCLGLRGRQLRCLVRLLRSLICLPCPQMCLLRHLIRLQRHLVCLLRRWHRGLCCC